MPGLFDDLIPTKQAPGTSAATRPPDYDGGQGLQLWFGDDQQGAPAGDAQVSRPAISFDDLVTGKDQKGPDFSRHGAVAGVDQTVRNIARGVPVLGAFADEGNAALAATVAPAVEWALDKIPGHDKNQDVSRPGEGYSDGWSARFNRSLNYQHGMDADYDKDHPYLSGAEKGVGFVGGLVGGALAAPAALAPVSSMLPETAGLIPGMAAGAVDGGIAGAAQGYGSGGGNWDDKTRWQTAVKDAEFGAAGGAVMPAALAGGKAVVSATARRLADALRGKVTVGPVANDAAAIGAQGSAGADPTAAAPQPPVTPAAAPGAAPIADGVGPHGTRWTGLEDRWADTVAHLQATGEGDAVGVLAHPDVPGRIDVPYGYYDAGTDKGFGMAKLVAKHPEVLPDLPERLARMSKVREQGNNIILASPDGTEQAVVSTDVHTVAGRQKKTFLITAYERSGRPDASIGGRGVDGGPTRSSGRPTDPNIGSSAPVGNAATPPLQVAASAAPNVTVGASDADAGYDRLYRALQRQNLTPLEAVQRARDLGPYGMMADVGDQTRDLGRSVFNLPGTSRTIARDNLNLRQQGKLEDGEYTVAPASTRVAAAAADGMGLAGRDYHSEIDTIVAGQRAAAGPAYAKAYAAPPAPVSEFGDFSGSPIFQKAYDRARAISQKEFVSLPDGSEKIVPLPATMKKGGQLDWRTLDLMKQGLDDMVKEGKVQGIGANERGALKGYLGRFVGKLDALNPDYGAARAAFAGPAKMKDAADLGRSFLREDAPVTAKAMTDMSDGEKSMFRIGALQALRDKLGNVNVTNDAARVAGFLQPNQLARFKELFPDQATYAKFANMLTREKTMFDTRGAVLGNSTTAQQMSDMADAESNPLETVGHVVAAAHGDQGSMGKVLAGLLRNDPNKMREGTANALGGMLFDPHTPNLAQTLDGLTAAQRRAMVADIVRRAGTPVGGQAGVAAGQRTQ